MQVPRCRSDTRLSWFLLVELQSQSTMENFENNIFVCKFETKSVFSPLIKMQWRLTHDVKLMSATNISGSVDGRPVPHSDTQLGIPSVRLVRIPYQWHHSARDIVQVCMLSTQTAVAIPNTRCHVWEPRSCEVEDCLRLGDRVRPRQKRRSSKKIEKIRHKCVN